MEWYIPILIFCARICDVSIGTVRMVFVISGNRWLSAVLGFFEVIIWALAVGGLVKYLSNPLALIAYGGGFATGTLVGMVIEEKIASGYRIVRVISRDPACPVAPAMRAAGLRATQIMGQGGMGPVSIVFMVIRRRQLGQVLAIVEKADPEAFITTERADRPRGRGAELEADMTDQAFMRRAWGKLAVRK